MSYKLPINKLYVQFTEQLYHQTGLTEYDLVNLLMLNHKKYHLDRPREFYESIMSKVLHNLLILNTGLCMLQLDQDSQQNQIKSPALQTELDNDSSGFNTDEAMATIIANAYGPIGLTNYGYNDVHKLSQVKHLDQQPHQVFADDLVSALVGAASGLILNVLSRGNA